MDQWLASLTTWLLGLVKGVFTALVTFLHDVALWVFDGVLQAVAGIVAAIPVPSFLSSGVSVGSVLSGMPPFTIYVVQQLGLSACLAVIAAGVTFRLTRKFVTLFQW